MRCDEETRRKEPVVGASNAQVDFDAMASTLGVPVKLLHEAMGHIITVELKTGQLYRGKLLEGAFCL